MVVGVAFSWVLANSHAKYYYIWYVMLQLPWLSEYSCIGTYAVSPPNA